MRIYYTFGFSHTDPMTGEPLHNKYVTIDGCDWDSGRLFMHALYGKEWSMEYGVDDYELGVAQYNLTEHAYYNLDVIRYGGPEKALTRRVIKAKSDETPQMSTDFPGTPFGRGDTITIMTEDDLSEAMARGEI